MKQSIEKRLDGIDKRMKPKLKYAPPDPAEYAQCGDWIVDTIAQICGACKERTPNDTGVIMSDVFTCSDGKYAFHCKTFSDDLLSCANNENDQGEKTELMKFLTWLNRNKRRLNDDLSDSKHEKRSRS